MAELGRRIEQGRRRVWRRLREAPAVVRLGRKWREGRALLDAARDEPWLILALGVAGLYLALGVAVALRVAGARTAGDLLAFAERQRERGAARQAAQLLAPLGEAGPSDRALLVQLLPLVQDLGVAGGSGARGAADLAAAWVLVEPWVRRLLAGEVGETFAPRGLAPSLDALASPFLEAALRHRSPALASRAEGLLGARVALARVTGREAAEDGLAARTVVSCLRAGVLSLQGQRGSRDAAYLFRMQSVVERCNRIEPGVGAAELAAELRAAAAMLRRGAAAVPAARRQEADGPEGRGRRRVSGVAQARDETRSTFVRTIEALEAQGRFAEAARVVDSFRPSDRWERRSLAERVYWRASREAASQSRCEDARRLAIKAAGHAAGQGVALAGRGWRDRLDLVGRCGAQ